MPHDTVPAVLVASGWLIAAMLLTLWLDARRRLALRMLLDRYTTPTPFPLLEPPPAPEPEPFMTTPPAWALRWPAPLGVPLWALPMRSVFPDPPPPPAFTRQPKATLTASVAAAFDQWHAQRAA